MHGKLEENRNKNVRKLKFSMEKKMMRFLQE